VRVDATGTNGKRSFGNGRGMAFQRDDVPSQLNRPRRYICVCVYELPTKARNNGASVDVVAYTVRAVGEEVIDGAH